MAQNGPGPTPTAIAEKKTLSVEDRAQFMAALRAVDIADSPHARLRGEIGTKN